MQLASVSVLAERFGATFLRFVAPWGALLGLCLTLPARSTSVALEPTHRLAAAAANDYAPLRVAVIRELEEYAQWCGSVKLAADRDGALRAILRFDAEHELARRGLKHTRQRDGTWAPPAKPAESKNANKNFEAQSRERREKLATGLLERASPLLAAQALDAPARRKLREELVADVLAIEPEHVAGRALGGEARRGDAWVLRETAASDAWRAKSKAAVQEVIARVPTPESIAIRPNEEQLGVAWTHAVATPRVRVLTTGGVEEARKAAVMCHAAIERFANLAGFTTDLNNEYTVYLLTSAPARDAWIGNWPGWSAAQREQFKVWAGCGVPGEIHQARWDADEARRLDGAVRYTLGLMCWRELKFDHLRCAWAWEGLGLYLTNELVGTHYTWFASAPAAGDAETKELLGKLALSDVNWTREHYQRVKRGKGTHFAKLCETGIDAFGADDMLASYSLASYLIEGRGEELPALLRALGATKPAEALGALFDGDLAQGDARMLRWLAERK